MKWGGFALQVVSTFAVIYFGHSIDKQTKLQTLISERQLQADDDKWLRMSVTNAIKKKFNPKKDNLFDTMDFLIMRSGVESKEKIMQISREVLLEMGHEYLDVREWVKSLGFAIDRTFSDEPEPQP